MECPVDHTTLQMSERHGVEIDYCPKCRGIWLDRGELDKIIELSASPATAARYDEPAHESHDYRNDHHDKHADNQRPGQPKKRGSFLGDLLGGFGED